jgi:hypothetical protein
VSDDWQHVATHIVVNCPEYRWELDEHRDPQGNQMMLAHISVFQFPPSLLKRMRETYLLFRQHVACPIFAVAGEIDDDKWERFISHFDFKYLTDVVCENGQKRRLFVSYPSNKQEEKHERFLLPGQSPERRADHEH